MRQFISLLFGMVLLALAGPAASQQPIVIKFSHVVAEDTPKGRAAIYFKRLAEERTNGRVKVEVYPNSQLYKDNNEIEALKRGSVQMLAPTLSKFGPLGVPEFEVFDLPYIFDNDAEVHRVTLGPIGKSLLKKLEGKGIVGLAFWDNGFKQMSANKPLRVPEDCNGLKMRIQPSKVLKAQMLALGASPLPMPFSDVYQALKTGKVDGTENPASNFYTQHMQDVQKDLTLSDHGYIGYAVIVNKAFWEGLPPDIRAILEQAMAEATRFANDIASEANNDALDAIRKTGKTQVIALTAKEKAEWKRALVRVHREMEGTIGRDLIQAIYKETNFDPTKF
jgi:C4-dicarboxylate-binding protein DctP